MSRDKRIELTENIGSSNLKVKSTTHRKGYNKAKRTHKCKTCTKQFSSKSSYSQHIKNHSDKKPFNCKVCKKGFIRRDYLTTHRRTHSERKPFECSFCHNSFLYQCSLNQHKKIHSGLKPFSCKVCNMSFIRKDYLTSHMKWHSSKKPFKCEICRTSFVRRDGLSKHIKTHTGEKPFQCETCKKKFARKDNLIAHIRRHKISIRNLSSKSFCIQRTLLGEKPFQRETCKRSFVSKDNLIVRIKRDSSIDEMCRRNLANTRHSRNLRRTFSDKKTLQCKSCKKSFVRKGNLIVHVEKDSSLDEMCKRNLANMRHSLNHRRTLSGKKPLQCETCKISLSRKNNIIVHVKRDSSIDEMCKRSLANMRHSCNQRRTLSVKKPFQCKSCKRSFVKKDNLIVHIKRHFYIDEMCKRSFTNRRHSRNQRRTLSGKIPFQCETCKISLSRKNNLIVHVKRDSSIDEMCKGSLANMRHSPNQRKPLSGEKSFKCEVCKESFARKGNLSVHMKTRSGKKYRSFKEINDPLIVHMKIHLSKEQFGCNSQFYKRNNIQTEEGCLLCTRSTERCSKNSPGDNMNPQRNPLAKDNFLFECQTCLERVSCTIQLERHLQVHVGDYLCLTCNEDYRICSCSGDDIEVKTSAHGSFRNGPTEPVADMTREGIFTPINEPAVKVEKQSIEENESICSSLNDFMEDTKNINNTFQKIRNSDELFKEQTVKTVEMTQKDLKIGEIFIYEEKFRKE